jgi:hypothetical protein
VVDWLCSKDLKGEKDEEPERRVQIHILHTYIYIHCTSRSSSAFILNPSISFFSIFKLSTYARTFSFLSWVCVTSLSSCCVSESTWCIYIYTYVNIYMCIIYVYIYVYICIFIYVWWCIYYIYIYIYIYVYMHIQIYIYKYVCIGIYADINADIYADIYIYTFAFNWLCWAESAEWAMVVAERLPLLASRSKKILIYKYIYIYMHMVK